MTEPEQPETIPPSAAERDEMVDMLRLALDNLARGPQPSYARGPLASLDLLTAVITTCDSLRDDAVANCRRSGAAWSVIGPAAGMTRQAAHGRWGPK